MSLYEFLDRALSAGSALAGGFGLYYSLKCLYFKTATRLWALPAALCLAIIPAAVYEAIAGGGRTTLLQVAAVACVLVCARVDRRRLNDVEEMRRTVRRSRRNDPATS